jgi:hypothetical protein
LLACTGLGSSALRTSLEGIVDGLMSVKVPSSLSNSSLASSEYAYLSRNQEMIKEKTVTKLR